MFAEVLSDKAQDLIDKIAGQISSFYLAGGTALALQLGHRVSEDLDFFILVRQAPPQRMGSLPGYDQNGIAGIFDMVF